MNLLITTLFLSGVLSAPNFNSGSTRLPKCDNGPSRFHTKKNMRYEYEGEILSGLVGTSEVRSGLKLRANCEISPVLPCLYVLKVTGAELLESQGKTTASLVYQSSRGSSELRRELLARDLYFESSRGVISNIKPDVGEPAHILNIKRGILSAFQLKIITKNVTVNEVDVNGECKAEYRVKSRHPSGKIKAIEKTKDLSLCSDRSQTNLGIPVSHYPTDKPFSFLSSKSVCNSVMSPKNRLGMVHCKETHLFRPFSSGYHNASGAMTTVRQTLKFVGHYVTSHDSNKIPDRAESSLRYDHSKNMEKTTKNDKEFGEILEKLVAEEGTKPDSARLFSKLIFSVRRLNMKAMKTIWYNYYECEEIGTCTRRQAEKYQKFIVDALSHCGTLDCAQFMVTAISDKKVGTSESINFLTGIALVGRPSEDMVGNILYFCQETPSRTAFLTLGTLINKYCRQYNCNKLNKRSSVYQADEFLQSKLRQNCKSSSPENIELITLVLKAIGNAGRPLSAVTNLLRCAVEPSSTVIKIEALQALRRIPCSTEITNGLLDIYKTLMVDTEVRIESYLALMRCPDGKIINKIADILDVEKNNQVGSFVWSHLTNALESSEPVHGVPLRNIISKALDGRELRSFNLDHLRYSHAYETSYYNKKQEVGGSSQAQVIFHPDSFFPRSAKVNLTVDVLGISVNLLETAARFEGFESLIEQMFGSEGYFPDERLVNMLKIKPTNLGNNIRESRSIKDEDMDEIKSNLEMLQDKMKIERKNPSGALSFKVFGHELQFLNFEDIDWLQGEADKINIIDTLINIARGGKYTFTKSFMFLEADHEVPTALGLPLRLSLNGSIVSSLELKGKFDIRNMFWGKKKFDVRGYVTPSAVVDISGKMTVDAKYASSGIHVNTSLYTATEINANATFKEGEGLKLSIEPPTKPIYIVNVTSNLATFLNKEVEQISGSPRRIERRACANFTKLVGVNFCGHISAPLAFRNYDAPYFPLSGESSFGMTFQTTNADLARFEIEGRQLTSNDDNRHDWMFNVHIPGLTFGKRLEANSTFQFLKDGKYLSVSGGIHGYKFGKFETKYNNNTNGIYTKFSTPEFAYLTPITIESEVFNKTNANTKEQDIGVSINATYRNFTVQEVVTLFKHDDQYGFKSNLTYWPRKHITAEGHISVVKKSVFLKMDDTISKSKLFFAGKVGKITNKFHVKIGNDIMNYGVKLDGEVNLRSRKMMMDIFVKPSRDLLKFEAYPRGNVIERGFYVKLLHVNTSSQYTGHLRVSHTETESNLKFNGLANNKPFSVRATRYVGENENKVELNAFGFGHSATTSLGVVKKSGSTGLHYFASLDDKDMESNVVLFANTYETGINMNAALMNKTVDVLAAYFHKGHDRGLRLKLTGGNKPVETVVTYFTGKEGKGLKFTMKGMGRSDSLILAYYNNNTETGLRMKASGLEKSIEVAASVFTLDNEKGLRVRANVFDNEMEVRWSILSDSRLIVKFAASVLKKNIELKSTYFKNDRNIVWRVDGEYDGKMKSLISTYDGSPSVKALCSELTDAKKVYVKVCTKLIRDGGENALQLNTVGFGRNAEIRISIINSDEQKGGRLQIKYNDALLSDVFLGVVTSSTYNGLRLRGNIYEKSMDAILKYENAGLKRSIDLQLRIQGNLVSFKTMWVRETSLQGVQFNVMHQNQPVGSAHVLLSRKLGTKVFKIGVKSVSNNGVEYKLLFGNSRIEKKLVSMVTVTSTSKKHYKYGWSIFYTNKGTTEQPNHVITTKLHHGLDKFLTSVYQMINTQETFSLLSKEEYFPGRVVTNKFAYSKLSRELFIQYEFVPGMRMTYSAALERSSQLLELRSTLTMLDYPMNSSIVLDKQTGRLRCTFSYSRSLPPVEITSHLRVQKEIDMGFSLSIFNRTWDNNFLLDYSSKQMKLLFSILPNVPVQMFAKIFDDKQFVFNITTCSAFSVQVAGKRPTSDEYRLIFKHEFLNNNFQDLELTINSLRDLKWESKVAMQLLERVMNISMRNLLNKTKETTRKMVVDLVNYVKENRDFLKIVINLKKELLQGDKINSVIKMYSSRATEIFNKMKENITKLIDEMKIYGTPLMETYTVVEHTLKEIVSELSPHLKSLSKDFRLWLWRSFDRYRVISICGKTLEGITWEALWKAETFYKLIVQKYNRSVTLLMSEINKLKPTIEELNRFVEKMKIATEEFTCNYDMECTSRNVEKTIKKFWDSDEVKKMIERFEKITMRLTDQYTKMAKLVLTKLENSKLQEKTNELLRAMKELLKPVVTIIKTNLRPMQEKAQEMYNMVVERLEMLKKMSRQQVQVLVRDEIQVYYGKLMQHVGRVNLTEVRDKLNLLVEKVLKLLRNKEKEILEKMTSAVKISKERVHDLKRRGTELYPKLVSQVKNMLERVKTIIKEYIELVKSRADGLRREQIERFTKAVEKVKTIMKETMLEYKAQMMQFAEQRYKYLMDEITLYKDMSIEEIVKELRNKTNTMVDKALGTLIKDTLTAYGNAYDYVRKMDFKWLEETWKRMLDITQDIQIKYQAVVEKQLKPMIKKFIAEIEKMDNRVVPYLKTRYNEAKLWYDDVKLIKFKEMYVKVRGMMQKWTNEMKKCCESCQVKLDEWKKEISMIIKEVKEESTNVAFRFREASEQVQQDAIETFRPYTVIVKNTLSKRKGFISERMTELRHRYPKTVEFVNEYRKAAEIYKTVILKKLINFDKKKVIDMMLESFNRSPFLVKVWESMNGFTILSQEFSRSSAVKILETINRCSLLVDARFRGFIVASQAFAKLSAKKMRESRNYLSMVKFVNDTRDQFDSRMERMMKDIENIGEMSLDDVQIRMMKFFNDKLLAPVKSSYNDLSDLVEKQLKKLVEKRKDLQKRLDDLLDRIRVKVADGKQWCEDIMNTTTEWTTRVWNINKPRIDAMLRFSEMLRNDIKTLTTNTMHMYKKFIEEHIAYKNFLKMTPNQLVQYIKEMRNESCVFTRAVFETVKTTATARLHMALTAMSKFVNEIDTDAVLRQAKLRTEAGSRTVRSLLQDSSKQLQNIFTEIVETVLFLNRFYGIEETLYNKRTSNSRMVQKFNEVKVKVMDYLDTNVSWDAMKIKVMAMVNNVEDIGRKKYGEIVVLVKKMNEKFTRINKFVNDIVSSDLPMLLESSKKNLTVLINEIVESLREARSSLEQKLNEKYPRITKFVNDIIRYDLPMLLESAQKNLTVLINETVESLCEARSSLEQKLNEIYPRIIKFVNDIIRYDLPMLLNSAKNNLTMLIDETVQKLNEKYRRISLADLPMLLDSAKKNLTMLVNITVESFRKTRSFIQRNVAVNSDYWKKNMETVMETIRQMKVSVTSGKLNLTLLQLDVIYKNMKTALDKQYVVAAEMMRKITNEVYPRFIVSCQETLMIAKETFRRLRSEAMIKWDEIKQEVTKFRQSTEKMWTPVRASFMKNFNEMDRMRRETMDVCTSITTNYYKKGKDIFDAVREINICEAIANYTRTLSQKTEGLVDNMKSKVSEMVGEIQKLRKQVMDKNWKMDMKKDILKLFESTKINQLVDIEDLMHKTIEISQDAYNISMIPDLLQFGRQCYDESKRLFELTRESSEFALYITKHVIQHSGIWDIVRKITDPFYWLPPSNSIAMIFGAPHVYTFDGKYYEFPGYKKPSCTYVLAHDFRDKNFSLMSKETSLILATKSGHITIEASGMVKATVSKDAEGKDVNVMYNELPVEMMHVTVKREGSFVKISHDQGIDITCDLNHFYCTFNINGFYHGKLAGLLGTNNNELYDEYMKPDKTIAKTKYDFANAWEVSGDPECIVAEKSPCKRKGSPRCKALFLDDTSPLARHFSSLNPKPFYEACIYDTSDCENTMTTESPTLDFCNVTAAYTAVLREKGFWASQLPECASCGSKTMWEKWSQKGSKSVDVVLLVPETLNMRSHAARLPTFLQELQTDLGIYDPRYAVVGFGGKSGVHRRPHIVTGGGNIFGMMQDVGKSIQNMQFTNEHADALDALEYVQRLPFKPGATKVVILLTDRNREENATEPMTTAMKNLKMHGIIFNVIGPYFQKKQHRNVLGLWKSQAYLKEEKRQTKLHTIGLPSDDYIRLAESSLGGIFNLKAYSRSHDEWNTLLTKAVKTTLIKQIDNDQVYCRQCVCVPSLASEPMTFCRINRHAKCN